MRLINTKKASLPGVRIVTKYLICPGVLICIEIRKDIE